MSSINNRYLEDDYVKSNPTWDSEDSPWKAERVASILKAAALEPESICEVGCGAGKILENLAIVYPKASFFGYDIAPAAKSFWKDINDSNIHLTVGDFFKVDEGHYDLLLLLDVLEHVADPHSFLEGIRGRSNYLIVHFPLDLSSVSVLREKPLLYVRRKVGHINYFSKGLALELMEECGFEVLDHRFTGAAFSVPKADIWTRLAQLPRRLVFALNKDFGVRLLGGETLMVLARAR